MSRQDSLFSGRGKHQKSPSVIPVDIEISESPDIPADPDLDTGIADSSIESSPESSELEAADFTALEVAEIPGEDVEWDQMAAEESGLEDVLEDLTTDEISNSQKGLISDKEETGDVEAIGADGGDDNTPELADDGVAEVAIAEDTDPVVEDTADADVDSELEDAIAEDADPVVEDTADADIDSELEDAIAEDVDSEDTTELAVNQDEEAEEADDDETVAEEDEEETESVLTEAKPDFTSGVFTVGASGEVTIDFLFDGGGYKGELAIFSLDGMDEFEPGSEEFIREAAGRALSNSTSGYVMISDQTEGAKFSGELGEGNSNSGEYLGAKTFTMRAGDKFGFMLVANGRVQQVFDNPDIGGAIRPLFSMATANPEDAFHVGQIADVTGNGNTFVMEDLRVDTGSDRDYNDIIFQVRGATGTAISLDEVIDPAKDWRETDLGELILAGESTKTEESDPVDIIKIQKPDVVDIVDDPTETDIPSVPFTASEIIKDDWVSSTAYAEGETTPNPSIPPIVDPALVVNPWDIDRSTLFPADYDPLIDGVGSAPPASTTVTVPSPGASPAPATASLTVSINNPPVVPSANVTLGLNENLGRYFFTAYDPDDLDPNMAYHNGGSIQQYYFQDVNTNSNSGYFTLDGVRQNGGFSLSASAIHNPNSGIDLKFFAASQTGVSDTIQVSAYDGKTWGNPGVINVSTTLESNRLPVVTAYNQTISPGTSLSSSFFTAADPDGDTIQRYSFSDLNKNSNFGYFVINGQKQTGDIDFILASQLANVRYVAGSQGTAETIKIGAYDGKAWGYRDITVATQDKQFVLNNGGWWADYYQGDFQQYKGSEQLPDQAAWGKLFKSWGHGGPVGMTDNFSARLTGKRYFEPGQYQITAGADDRIRVRIDGKEIITAWAFGAPGKQVYFDSPGGYHTIEIDYKEDAVSAVVSLDWLLTKPQENRAPVVTASDRTISLGSTSNATSLFTAIDPDGDYIPKYIFRDNNPSETSGYFTLNGVKQSGIFFVTPSQLANVKFVGGSQNSIDKVQISAEDGKLWGTKEFVITSQGSTVIPSSTNRAPVVTTTNRTIANGEIINPNFFTVADPDGDVIQRYYLSSNYWNPADGYFTNGYFTVNGVKQNGGFFVDANQLASVKYVGGSPSNDWISVYAYDGKDWGYNDLVITQSPNRVPVLTDAKLTLEINSGVAASSLFIITDADGDVIQKYNFYDDTTRSTSGYFTLNGVRQNGSFSVDASQLTNVRFFAGSEAGVDWLSIDAYDGKGWSDAPTITVTTKQPNRAPVVTTTNQTLNVGTRIFAFDFFNVTDADGDATQQYYFYDANPSSTSGYLTFNGVKQDAGFLVAPSQLSNVRFVAGSQAGTDTVYVQASDGKTWSNYPSVSLTTQQPNRVPVVTAYNNTLETGTSINASSFFTVSDADGDAIQQYSFYDNNSSSTSGYFTLNGVKQDVGFSVTASQLANVKFVAGSQATTDTVFIQAYDGKAWNTLGNGAGAATLTTKQANRAPIVTTTNRTINTGTVTNADFFTVTDPDGDVIQQYYFSDNNSGTTSGYFTLNGVKQTAGFYVAANQLASVKFVAGSIAGSDSVTVYASDGKTWGVNNATITTQQVNRAPIVTTYNQNLNIGTNIAANFFTVSDPDGDVIQQYYFADNNTSSTSGYFTLNGVRQAAGFSVFASQLASVKFVAGSQVGTDTVTVYASDGKTWGSRDVALNTQQPNRPPVVTTYNQTVKRGNSISPNFSVTDADGDAITQYAFYDSNATSTSGYFTVNGVKQTAGAVFYVNANQLSSVKFVGGSTSGTDGLYVSATDGKAWSAWSNYTTTTTGGSAPTVTLGSATVNANTTTSLNLNATDPDGNPVTRYEFFDGNTTATSGYFTINGVKQAAGSVFSVDASQLSTVKFVGGATGGIDQVAVRGTDGLDGWSTWSYANLTTQAVVTNDWFDLNIKDTTIRSLARSKFQDGIFSRQDMIEIFDSAKDASVVDANEFADLKLLASDVTYIKMADHVRNLSQKVALGNTANAKYLGQTSYNLSAGSSADQLQKLVNEHFFGKDLPLILGEYAYGSANQATYQYTQGNLFQGGIHYTDIRQGAVGDCYYLAALAGIAIKDASKIQDMFIDNGDGTYTVRFFNNGKADYVTVDRQLPAFSYGYLPFAKVGASNSTYSNTSNELWVALAEKAYAQINEAGWLGDYRDGTNSYKGIEGGWMHTPTTQVTNWAGSRQSLYDLNPVVSAFTSGKAVAFGSKSLVQSPVVKGHAYTMVDYANGQFKLFNPWGVGNSQDNGYVYQTWNQLVSNYSSYTVNG